jgi:hypothetical protein
MSYYFDTNQARRKGRKKTKYLLFAMYVREHYEFSIFFRELDQHCEDNYLINKGVYGCRPNRRAIDPVFVDVF